MSVGLAHALTHMRARLWIGCFAVVEGQLWGKAPEACQTAYWHDASHVPGGASSRGHPRGGIIVQASLKGHGHIL